MFTSIAFVALTSISTSFSLLPQDLSLPLAQSSEGQKSPTAGLFWSLGATLVPVGLAVGLFAAGKGAQPEIDELFAAAWVVGTLGLVAGPSAGHFYAGNTQRGLLMTGLRTATGVGGALSLGLGIAKHLSDDPEDKSGSGELALLGVGLLVVTVGLAVYDIATASNAVEEYNKKFESNALSFSVWSLPQRKAYGGSVGFRL